MLYYELQYRLRNSRALYMEFALTKLYELCLILQKDSNLFIQIRSRVWMWVSPRKSIPCDVSCWNKNKYRPMRDSQILKSPSRSAFEPILLSSSPYLSPPAAISAVPSRLSQRDVFYQVAANVVLAAGWPISISFSRERLCRLFTTTE